MSSIVIVGSQWGDEGKGKITDFFGQSADIIARYQGGDNAGHTIVFNGNSYHLQLIPSGIFDQEKYSVIGNGVVVNPKSLINEMDNLKKDGISTDNLRISNRAQVIMPYHILFDGLQEQKKDSKIGTTNKGIGPAYMDKYERIGIRIADLIDKDIFEEKLRSNLAIKNELLTKSTVKNYSNLNQSLMNIMNTQTAFALTLLMLPTSLTMPWMTAKTFCLKALRASCSMSTTGLTRLLPHRTQVPAVPLLEPAWVLTESTTSSVSAKPTLPVLVKAPSRRNYMTKLATISAKSAMSMVL